MSSDTSSAWSVGSESTGRHRRRKLGACAHRIARRPRRQPARRKPTAHHRVGTGWPTERATARVLPFEFVAPQAPGLTILITPVERHRAPQDVLATAALAFTAGPLKGLVLTGFNVWTPREGETAVGVTFPTAYWRHGGERWRYRLLRVVSEESETQAERLRGFIRQAYQAAAKDQGDARPRHDGRSS